MKNRENDIAYKELNTPLVNNMLNMMQFVYGDEDIRGKFDKVVVEDKEKMSAPIFSALTAFILSTALAMRMPGQEKIPVPTELPTDVVLKKIQAAMESVEVFFTDPDLKSDLIKCLELYILNGKWGGKAAVDKDHFYHLKNKKKDN